MGIIQATGTITANRVLTFPYASNDIAYKKTFINGCNGSSASGPYNLIASMSGLSGTVAMPVGTRTELLFSGSGVSQLYSDYAMGYTGANLITLDSSTQVTLKTTKTNESTALYGLFTTELKEVSTTDATVTDIYTWSIQDDAATVADVIVTASDDTASAVDGWKGTIMYRRAAGTVTIDGASNVTQLGASAWAVTIDNSTSTGRVRVTGAAATNIRWTATVRLQTTRANAIVG